MQIRELVERWATAVQEGDLDGVLADHSDDIVMFDVPPPTGGVRGVGAYRDCCTQEEFDNDPDNPLRLTIGLRKERERWVVRHEHYSFPDKTVPGSTD